MLEHLDRDQIRRRFGLWLAEVFKRAGSPKAVGIELKRMGFAAPDGSTYSERTMRAWRAMEHMPSPDVVFALAARYSVSIDEYAFGERRSIVDQLLATVAENERFLNLVINWAGGDKRFREMVRMREPEMEGRMAG